MKAISGSEAKIGNYELYFWSSIYSSLTLNYFTKEHGNKAVQICIIKAEDL
jgi:hypothetical protein